jgi:hypothetical protein
VAGALGLVAVLGNVLGVAFLHGIPGAYRLAGLDAWLRAVPEQRWSTAASAISFVVGLLAMAHWASYFRSLSRSAVARLGAELISTTALFNAAGCITPLVLAFHVGGVDQASLATGRALLGITLTLDALFNLGLAVGLILLALGGAALGSMRGWMLAAGLASLPVAAQAVWDPAADLLLLAGPLWLWVVTRTSFDWMKNDALRAA